MTDLDQPIRLRLAGPITQVGNNAPLSLSDPDLAHVVEAGELVVFAVESVDGQAGPRRFVLAAGPGEAVFGVPPTARLELVGTGNLGTQVRSMPVVELRASANEEAAALLAGWAGRLTAGVARYDRTTAGERGRAGAARRDRGRRLDPRSGCLRQRGPEPAARASPGRRGKRGRPDGGDAASRRRAVR